MAMAFQRIRLLMRRSISRLPGNRRLSSGGDGVDVGRVGGEGDLDAAAYGLVLELAEQELRPFFAAGLHDRVEGVEPFRGFDGIDIANAFMGVGLDMPITAVGERAAFAVARAADGFHITAAPLGAVCHCYCSYNDCVGLGRSGCYPEPSILVVLD